MVDQHQAFRQDLGVEAHWQVAWATGQLKEVGRGWADPLVAEALAQARVARLQTCIIFSSCTSRSL